MSVFTAIPDLIRLVHGNPSGIKKLIKEFRMYWKLKTSPEEIPATMDDTSGSPGDKEPAQPDVSMEIDEKDDKEKKDTVAGKKVVKDDFAISKRQLEMKIPSIAVREKRPELKKISWYVKDEVLKQYNMEDIKLPNTWDYVCVKAPKWAEEKQTPKVGEDSGSAAVTGGRNTPNIMQFAQPMSPAVVMTMGTPKQEQTKGAAAQMETGQTATPDKEAAVPADQRTILSMFTKKSNKPKKTVNGKGSDGNAKSVNKSPDSSVKSPENKNTKENKTKCETSPNLHLGNLFNVKPINQSPAPVVIPDQEAGKIASPRTPVTAKQLGFSVIDTVLTSPELMKASPKNEVKNVIVIEQDQEPMEVIELD